MIFMVSVCKTVTDPSRKIITNCVGVRMACFQSLNTPNIHLYMEKIQTQQHAYETIARRPGNTTKEEPLPQEELGGGP